MRHKLLSQSKRPLYSELIHINGVVSMQDRPYRESDDQSVGTASEAAIWPAGHWNWKDSRSYLDPDSCDC